MFSNICEKEHASTDEKNIKSKTFHTAKVVQGPQSSAI